MLTWKKRADGWFAQFKGGEFKISVSEYAIFTPYRVQLNGDTVAGCPTLPRAKLSAVEHAKHWLARNRPIPSRPIPDADVR
jgi:hypothetical protein